MFLDILYCFPTTLPVTPQNMSYVSIVSAGLVGFVIALWFTTKRGTFVGPKVDFDLINARRQQAIGEDLRVISIEGQSSNTVSMEGGGKDSKACL
jgi:choline transport protein